MRATPRHGRPFRVGRRQGRWAERACCWLPMPGWCPTPVVRSGFATRRLDSTAGRVGECVVRPVKDAQQPDDRESGILPQRHGLVSATCQAGFGTDPARRRLGGDAGGQGPGAGAGQVMSGDGVVRAPECRGGDQGHTDQEGQRATVTARRSLARHVTKPLSITRRASTITRRDPRDQWPVGWYRLPTGTAARRPGVETPAARPHALAVPRPVSRADRNLHRKSVRSSPGGSAGQWIDVARVLLGKSFEQCVEAECEGSLVHEFLVFGQPVRLAEVRVVGGVQLRVLDEAPGE